MFFDFHHDVVYAREIDFRRFQLGFGQALFGFELRYAGGFFDNRAALHRFRRENLPDAALLDDGVGIGAEANSHEHVLNVAQAGDAPVNEIFTLAAAVESAADDNLAWLGDQRGLVHFFLSFALKEFWSAGFRACRNAFLRKGSVGLRSLVGWG